MTVIDHNERGPADTANAVVHAPIDLDPLFPLEVGPLATQDDRPIRQLHWHDSVEIGLCLEGAGIFVIGERVVPFTQGDVTIIGPAQIHLARSMPGTVSMWRWIYLDPIRMLRLLGDFADPRRVSSLATVITDDPASTAIARDLVDESDDRRAGFEPAAEALVVQLFVRALRTAPDAPATPSVETGSLARIAPAIALITAHLAEPLSLARLATACGTSEATMRRLFIAATGRSPQQYWIDLRMQMAASMLRSTRLSVLAISLQVGFQTLSSFNEQFRTRYAMTPRQWRTLAH